MAKHRLFVRLDARICPDHRLIVIARDDDTTFGILHSRFHEAWSLRLGTSLEDRPRYTPTTTFETFPFPDGLSPLVPAEEYADDPRSVAGGANRSPVEPPLSPTDHAARSTSNAARLRASLLNSTAIRWIGWPRCRYLSA